MEIIIRITDEKGKQILESSRERNIPFVEEFDEQGFRKSFDQIEAAVLETRKEVSEEAISEYMKKVSKKKSGLIGMNDVEITESESKYIVESEIGVIDITTHKVIDSGNNTVYDVSYDYFDRTQPKEKFRSTSFNELVLDLAAHTSYRCNEKIINRIRHEGRATKACTIRNTVEKEGDALLTHAKKQAEDALVANGFSKEGVLINEEAVPKIELEHIDDEIVMEAARELNLKEESIKPEEYEHPDQTINISVDDVSVSRQASKRPDSEEKGKKKKVMNTVIHIQEKDKSYILNAESIVVTLLLLMGFLASNSLIWTKRIVFFIDGEINLRKSIVKMFSSLEIKIVLDWYHVNKKVKERLSMGMKGYRLRNPFLEKLNPLLWLGKVDAAILLIRGIPPDQIKSQEHIEKLIEYLERNKPYIPCYSMRAKLGLRNSSNRGEKSNDIVVADRQKHNGMSWSKEGSVSLAAICAAENNGELMNWVSSRSLSFSFSDPKAA